MTDSNQQRKEHIVTTSESNQGTPGEIPISVMMSKFVCPGCGNPKGYFGTFTFHDIMAKSPESEFFNKGYKTGDQIGYCRADEYFRTGCSYKWVRTDESDKTHFFKEEIRS
jgi:hypothetical protein